MQENNNMRYHIQLLTFVLITSFVNAQGPLKKPPLWKGDSKTTSDTSSLLYAFKNGDFDGRARYYFSSTINEAHLTDFYANAIGTGIRYETRPFHGFQFAASGYFTFNIASSDLSVPDPTTNKVSRYALGLFDVTNPGGTRNLAQNEELYLKYSHKKFQFIFGRQFLHTPLLNLQDGRMHPTSVEGLWLGYAPSEKWSFQGGWLYRIYPRSTNKWYSIEESMGLYPQGRNTNGAPADYQGNLKSSGLGVFNIEYKPVKKLKIQLWDYYLDNIINSAYAQINGKIQLKNKDHLLYGGQFLRQDAINHGGNVDPELSYTEKGASSMAFGGQFGYQKNAWSVTLNYNRITEDGKFLFPREWGRDPFFTFMPRERNEGFGDVHAVTTRVKYNPKSSPVFLSLAAGYFNLPDIVTQSELNKYAVPSYYQANFDFKYKHQKWLKGLESHLLLVTKIAEGNTYDNPNFVFQKVNMLHINLMLNYYF